MTNKEIAERIRKVLKSAEVGVVDYETLMQFEELADALDPPRAKPGELVWCRNWHNMPWAPGFASPKGVYRYSSTNSMIFDAWDDIEWKPARILADDEVAVKVPPVSEWGNAGEIIAAYNYANKEPALRQTIITRAEAEAREAGR